MNARVIFRLLPLALAAGLFLLPWIERSSAQNKGFTHTEQHHKSKDCAFCHKMPTANWLPARGYPDVAQFPGHASCFGCHKTSAVFTGGKPTFCLGCHSDIAPGRAPFRKFPIASKPREFNIAFPHKTHQDLLANLLRRQLTAPGHFVNASWSVPDEKNPVRNSCAVCHSDTKAVPVVKAPPIKEGLEKASDGASGVAAASPVAGFFKADPEGHATCFACHFSGIKAPSTDCKGCHVAAPAFKPTETIARYSVRFDHAREQHKTDCMSCHVRIAQSEDSRSLKDPDVPVLACVSCHGKPFNSSDRKNKDYWQSALNNEIIGRQKEKTMVCAYCHSDEVGRYDIPASHLALKK